MAVPDKARRRFPRPLSVLGGHKRGLEARKASHDLDDWKARDQPFQVVERRVDRGGEDEPGRPMLAHRADDFLLADRVFCGIGEKRDEARVLASLFDADREFDIEGVRKVVDDHAENAGPGAPEASPRPGDRYSQVRTSLRRRVPGSRRRQGNCLPAPERLWIWTRRPRARRRRWSPGPRSPRPPPHDFRRSCPWVLRSFQHQRRPCAIKPEIPRNLGDSIPYQLAQANWNVLI